MARAPGPALTRSLTLPPLPPDAGDRVLEHIPNLQPPDPLKAEAQHVTERLSTFVRAAWHIVEPATPFVPNWHIDAVCDHLEAVSRGEIRRLLITMPPRRGKSRVVSVMWPAWLWTFKPSLRLLFASYSADLASDHSKDTRVVIESAWYQARFGRVFKLTSDQNVKTYFQNDKRGYRLATSVGAKATGFGGDIIVSDDLLSRDDGGSPLILDRTLRWFDLVLSKCLNDPKTGAQVMIMQRIHQRDPAGHVIEQGDWEHLCLPEEYDPGHPFLWPDDPRSEPGELLWGQRFGREEAEKEKRKDPHAFAGLYQQIPTPREGLLVKRHWWRYFDPAAPPDVWALIQSWDTALTEKTTSDWTVGQLWGLRGANRYLLRSVRGRWDLVETKRQIRAMCEAAREHDAGGAVPMTILVENTANGPKIIADMRHEIQGIVPVNPQKWGSKMQRVFAVTPQLEAGNVHLRGWPENPDARGADYRARRDTPPETLVLIEECASFTGSPADTDDQVDALTMALIRAAHTDVQVPDEARYDLNGSSGKLDESLSYTSRF